MNAKELAALLNGCKYLDEVSKELEAQAKENRLVIVFGCSDDLMEFRGAIYDELDAYDGTTAYLDSNGLLENKCSDDCPYFAEKKDNAVSIEAKWCSNDIGASWTFETSIPHETFDVIEDGEIYCRGIVFSLDSVLHDEYPEGVK
ncbi:MAG: hypothetical protein LBQ81_08240 [Zoogloeaceae bacterium]|jgi:hypothetical protein|nr:hypothetical protein [Zoogloeaceae bacterium]